TGSLLAMVNVPDCAPALVGLKRTLTCADPPAWMLKGAAGVTAYTALELVIAETLNAALPLFAIVIESCAEVPVATVPKLSDAGETEIRGPVGPPDPTFPDTGTCSEG